MATSLIVIWTLYVLVNILWQFGITWSFRAGFIDHLQAEDSLLYKFVVEYASSRSLTLQQAYRKISTMGLNVFALPVASVASIVAVIISHI